MGVKSHIKYFIFKAKSDLYRWIHRIYSNGVEQYEKVENNVKSKFSI